MVSERTCVVSIAIAFVMIALLCWIGCKAYYKTQLQLQIPVYKQERKTDGTIGELD